MRTRQILRVIFLAMSLPCFAPATAAAQSTCAPGTTSSAGHTACVADTAVPSAGPGALAALALVVGSLALELGQRPRQPRD